MKRLTFIILFFIDCKSFLLSIDYQINDPKAGIQFVMPKSEEEHFKVSSSKYTIYFINRKRNGWPTCSNF